MSEKTYTTTSLARLLGVSLQTVRNYTAEYARHLSPGANPSAGDKRVYTVTDAKKLLFVADAMARGTDQAAIHASLDNGARGDIDQGALVDSSSTPLTADYLRLKQQRDTLQGRLDATQAIAADQRAELERQRDKIEQLNRLIGALEYQICQLKQKD